MPSCTYGQLSPSQCLCSKRHTHAPARRLDCVEGAESSVVLGRCRHELYICYTSRVRIMNLLLPARYTTPRSGATRPFGVLAIALPRRDGPHLGPDIRCFFARFGGRLTAGTARAVGRRAHRRPCPATIVRAAWLRIRTSHFSCVCLARRTPRVGLSWGSLLSLPLVADCGWYQRWRAGRGLPTPLSARAALASKGKTRKGS